MVYFVDPLEDTRWPELLQSHPDSSVFHSVPWLRALRDTYGYQPLALTTSAPGEDLHNGLVFCRVESWLTGGRWVSLPFSDHAEPLLGQGSELADLLLTAQATCDQEDLRYLEIRPLRPVALEGYTPSPYVFHTLDLAPGLDTLFGNLHEDSIRRKIRRAQREGLVYSEGRSADHLESFYRLMVQTRKRHGLPPQPKEWFQNLATCFGPDLKVRIASQQTTPVAAILTLRHQDTLVYKYGCSDQVRHNLGGMQMLMWRAIEEAKQAGLRTLDLGRSDAGNTGLITYKDRWGTQRSQLTYWRRKAKAVPGTATGNWKMKLAGRMFSHLPAGMNSFAGRVLYRHLG